jgi:DNA repair protein RecO (recombination protein O)
LNVLTPDFGKLTVMAKGVRKEKSKLAGAVEMFSLSEITVHRGRAEMGVLTGARLARFYGGILEDYERLVLATEILRKVAKVAEQVDSAEFFEVLEQVFGSLDSGVGLYTVRLWAGLRILGASGEEVNLWTDSAGERLRVEVRYEWDGMEKAFRAFERGAVGAEEIKLLRLMVSAPLDVVSRVVGAEERSRELVGRSVV